VEDLHRFVLVHLNKNRPSPPPQRKELEYVLNQMSTPTTETSSSLNKQHIDNDAVITFERFVELLTQDLPVYFNTTTTERSSQHLPNKRLYHVSPFTSATTTATTTNTTTPTPPSSPPRIVESLGELERVIVDISTRVSSSFSSSPQKTGRGGHLPYQMVILPSIAFRYFSEEVEEKTSTVVLSSPIQHTKTTRTMVDNRPSASFFDPLTPSKLKTFLKKYHGIQVSTRLISQFFLHIGATNKHFLELTTFSKWAAPLSLEM
jgi:hypothetical protein